MKAEGKIHRLMLVRHWGLTMSRAITGINSGSVVKVVVTVEVTVAGRQ